MFIQKLLLNRIQSAGSAGGQPFAHSGHPRGFFQDSGKCVVNSWAQIKGDCYLYIRNKRGKLKVLALERILDIDNTYIDIIPTGDEDIYTLLDDPFGFMSDMEETEVVLMVDTDQAPFEKAMNWPGSVKLTDNADGSLTIRARTHSYFDLMRWILARTPHIKVLSPDWVREDAIKAMKEGIEANTFPDAMDTVNSEDIVDAAGRILEEHLEAFKELAR